MYLKEFRVEQCPLFLQHKCTQHKPFTCFYWHFMNQRRRRPVRRRDGTFNYSPDVYCSKYDETTGICPDGDDCSYLHRTAGDTERRYHLRYYKTGVCVYDTDTRGYCVKNGPHCAFAHGIHDLRNPVYDLRELQAMESNEEGPNGISGPNNLDKERNALNEDPKWQDTNYVLANYKTEQCKRPPRLCRQGYACPSFHNNRDRRRSPKKSKYRSTPCPNVKQADEWGDPANCENGDSCPYCHTRTEQQFHPEIYKSTKCNDILQTGYCPRGPFCAFAHVDKEISAVRDLGPDHTTDLAAILSSALPPSTSSQNQHIPDSQEETSVQKSDQSTSEPDQQNVTRTTNSLPEVQSSNTLDHYTSSNHPLPTPISRPRSYSSSTNHSGESMPHYPKAPGSEREDREACIRRQLQAIDDDPSLEPLEKARRKQSIYLACDVSLSHLSGSMKTMSPLATSFYPAADTVESVVGNALDDLSIDDINVEASLNRELINDTGNSSISGIGGSSLLGASAPVNIPCSGDIHDRGLPNLSPPVTSPLGSLSHSLQLGSSSLTQTDHSLDKAAAAFYGHSGSFTNSKLHYPGSSLYDFAAPQNMSPSNRMGTQQSLVPSIGAFNSLGSSNLSEIQRLRDEFATNRLKMPWDDGTIQARSVYQTYEVWKREAEEASRRERLAEQQRDEALAKVSNLQKELDALTGGPFLHTLTRISELETLPLSKLKQLQEQLREDLEKIEKVVFYQTATKCMICEDKNRSITVVPCSHYVLCNQCAPHQKNCPYCHEAITSLSNASL
ncbi:putative E3 ubiquitin-protein ligase UNKL isoform X2 [Stegodyphus dumicola]|uniref:putative E3 ubiquitin-protein ligase UNKL isoform X2 n=1 Tax=Stegodyphus dumicola TaxID=202533 RepID=UPI0015AD678E|nr:putative E3 ubiquitin-protein ligase UNKL isoform X2 [Stegodyphus dumicola]